ncbi:NAD(P)-dependent dehydrogenase (short-subunit alcohol dehydrogenase family) [Bradyrhizobium sp. F1.13.1]
MTILVNNAGIPDAQRATKMPIDLIDRVLDTNVRAPYVLSCEVARRLIVAKRSGRIVNIASSSAYSYGGNGAALYSISKAAVVRMSEALAVEWAKFNINVNAIAPGAFSSEMMDGMLQRVGRPYEGISATAHRQPSATGQHVAVPSVAVIRFRDRHLRTRGRRSGMEGR